MDAVLDRSVRSVVLADDYSDYRDRILYIFEEGGK